MIRLAERLIVQGDGIFQIDHYFDKVVKNSVYKYYQVTIFTQIDRTCFVSGSYEHMKECYVSPGNIITIEAW